jgi:hypothetical protein
VISSAAADATLDFTRLMGGDVAGFSDSELSNILGTSTAGAEPPLLDTTLDESLLSLLYPNWPSDLPSPSVVSQLCELFFATPSLSTCSCSLRGETSPADRA